MCQLRLVCFNVECLSCNDMYCLLFLSLAVIVVQDDQKLSVFSAESIFNKAQALFLNACTSTAIRTKCFAKAKLNIQIFNH